MKNYLQIEIAGKKAGLKFVYDAVKHFNLVAEKQPDRVYPDGTTDSGFTCYGFAVLVEGCYLANCDAKKVAPELTFEEIYDHVNDSQVTEEGQKEMGAIYQGFAESTVVKNVQAANEKKSMSQ